MNLDQFIGKYGYTTASLILREAAEQLPESRSKLAAELHTLAEDLYNALKSVEGKVLPE